MTGAVGPQAAPAPRRGLGLLLGLALALPLLVPLHRSPSATFDAELLAVLLLGILAIAAGVTVRSREISLGPCLPAFLCALCAVAGIHWWTGSLVYSFQVSSVVLYSFVLLIAYLAGRAVVDGGSIENVVRLAAGCLAAAAVASVLIECAQLLHVLPDDSRLLMRIAPTLPRPVANVGQPNVLAAFLGGAVLAVLLLLDRGLRRAGAVAVMPLLALGIALTGSRMGLLFIAIAIAAAHARGALRIDERRWRIAITLALAGGFVAGVACEKLLLDGALRDHETVLERLAGGATAHSANIERMQLWCDAAQVSGDAPLLGVGPGQFAAARYERAGTGSADLNTPYPHNVVLQLAAEYGWPVALGFVLLVIYIGFGARHWAGLGRERALAVLLLLVTLIHALLEFPLWILYLAIPACFWFAVAEGDAISFPRRVHGRVLMTMGAATLFAAVAMTLDFTRLAAIGIDVLGDLAGGMSVAEATDAAIDNSQHTYFRPWAERMALDSWPLGLGGSDALVEMSARSIRYRASPHAIARHVVLLAQTGHIDDAARAAEKLRTFAGIEWRKLATSIGESVNDKVDGRHVLRTVLDEPPLATPRTVAEACASRATAPAAPVARADGP